MTRFTSVLITVIIAGLATASLATAEPTIDVVKAGDVQWEHLNPARGDKSPSAGTLWGDRNGTGPTGFLLRPTDGFESPPHIHNVSYRAVVISGLIHNDDPEAADMWLPAGSFWTQPKGEVHITAARGTNTMAYVEIDAGPYLVLPTEQAFDSGERPINVDESNVVWVSAADVAWVDQSGRGGPQVAYLWGTPDAGSPHGLFVKLPAGYAATMDSDGSVFRAVVIQGQVDYAGNGLETGSYFGTREPTTHHIISDTGNDTILYIQTNGSIAITPAAN